MNHLDTFSGIGGWALASRWMGWQTLAFVEKDPFCTKVLNKNFPGVPVHDDIFTFSGKPFRGRVDILTGSTPCQPFSAAGKRQGSNDDRHLFPEFLRVVAECKPRWIIIENVYGLVNIESGRVFEDYHTHLESEGYSVQTICIPASSLGAPHRRDRLWIIAHANGKRERAGHREIRGSNGKVPKRNDDAESGNSSLVNAPHSPSLGRRKGRPESTGRERAADVVGADSEYVINSERERCERRSGGNATVEGSDRANDGLLEPADSDAADTSESGLSFAGQTGVGELSTQTGSGIRDRPEFDNRDASNARDTRLQGSESTEGAGLSGFGYRGRENEAQGQWSEPWPEVAARLCTLDARLPGGLVRSRGWRVNALKAGGNSIVPHIAYEIFKAIEAAEQMK